MGPGDPLEQDQKELKTWRADRAMLAEQWRRYKKKSPKKRGDPLGPIPTVSPDVSAA